MRFFSIVYKKKQKQRDIVNINSESSPQFLLINRLGQIKRPSDIDDCPCASKLEIPLLISEKAD